MNWQPIVDAPENERVLLFVPESTFYQSTVLIGIFMPGDGWHLSGRSVPYGGPTHWMPLPPPPTQGPQS